MADFKPKYGTASALTVTGLHSLAAGAFWQSAGQNNNSDLGVWVDIFITLQKSTTSGSSTGYANVYLAGSVDGGTDFAGGASGSEGAYAPTDPSAAEQSKQMILLGAVPMVANTTGERIAKAHFRIPPWCVPKNWSLVIENQLGAALKSSGSSVEVLVNQIQSV